jgi:predicted metal-dependent peptidase
MDKMNRVLTSMLLSANPEVVADACAIRCLKLIPTTKVATAATDGMVLIYNPAYVDGLSDRQVAGLLVHEMCHVRFHHCERLADSGYIDRDRANKSMDREINGLLLDAGFELPDGGLHPYDINCPMGLSWEEYYPKEVVASDESDEPEDEANEQPEPEPEDGDGNDDEKPADGDGNGEEAPESPADDAEKQGGESSEGDGDNASTGLPEGSDSGTEGQKAGSGDVDGGAHPAGELAKEFAPELLEETTPDEVAEAVRDAAQKSSVPEPPESKGRSDTFSAGTELKPGGLIVCKTGTDWRAVVIDLLATRVGGERLIDWSRPSRRSVSSGTYMPSKPKMRAFKIALVLDVSGSCVCYFDKWQSLAREMLEEIRDITEVDVWYHDTRTTGQSHWLRAEGAEIEIESSGGGGTSHIPVLKEVEETDVDIAILFTDCDTRWPKSFGIDCVTVQPPFSRSVCPFGQNVRSTNWE